MEPDLNRDWQDIATALTGMKVRAAEAVHDYMQIHFEKSGYLNVYCTYALLCGAVGEEAFEINVGTPASGKLLVVCTPEDELL